MTAFKAFEQIFTQRLYQLYQLAQSQPWLGANHAKPLAYMAFTTPNSPPPKAPVWALGTRHPYH
jgi:hypothetical protein